jgi:membrane protein involved in colicin uptake
METTVVNPKDFGIEESKANELVSNLPQILDERKVLEEQFSEIVKMDIEDLETSKKARELRLLIQKNRTQGISVWHRTSKDYFLRGGQFIDAIKKKEIVINERMEETLEDIEKYAENKERERLNLLQQERAEQVTPYVETIDNSLFLMEQDVWEAYLQTKINNYNAKIEAERKAEEERIAKQKAEEERIRLQEIENARLKAEAIKREKEIEEERKKQAEILAKEKADAEAKAKAVREEAERKADIERKKYEEELRLERERQAKIQQELKAKQDAENARIESENKARELELSKGDADKIKDLISDLESLKTKYSFKSEKNIKKYNDVGILISKVIEHINK